MIMPRTTIRVGTTEGRFRMIMLTLMTGHFDLHQQMAQENLAACFSLSMYLPHLHELNLYNDNKLLVFPIKDLTETNPVYILTNKDNAYVEGTDEFKHLLKNVVKDLEVSDR